MKIVSSTLPQFYLNDKRLSTFKSLKSVQLKIKNLTVSQHDVHVPHSFSIWWRRPAAWWQIEKGKSREGNTHGRVYTRVAAITCVAQRSCQQTRIDFHFCQFCHGSKKQEHPRKGLCLPAPSLKIHAGLVSLYNQLVQKLVGDSCEVLKVWNHILARHRCQLFWHFP